MDKQEAIKILKNFHDTSALFSVRTALETAFPELKEDEDELEWLKQFIQEEVDNLSIDIRDDEDRFKLKMLQKSLKWLEKQGEQKPDDKTELKFKVDDWVVDNNGKIAIIYDLQKAGYVGHYNDGTDFVCKYNNEHLLHLWTIQDAKDGDVLQLGKITAIFKEFISNEHCKCCCSVYNGEFEIRVDNIYGCYNATPATKEQRDLLFQKMNESGYEWDSEKKELKIIDWSKHVKYEPNSPSIIEENTEWSEEDVRNIENIDAVLFYDKDLPEDTCMRLRNWLKSLKNRIGG